MTEDDDSGVTHLMNGYALKKGNVVTYVMPYDSSEDADLIIVIFKFTYGKGDVSYRGYRVEIDNLPTNGHKKSHESESNDELKQQLLDAANHRNGRYVELESKPKSQLKVKAHFVHEDADKTEVFYSTSTANIDLSVTTGSSYEEFLKQLSRMSKDYLLQKKETNRMRDEVQVMKNAMEELVTDTARFKDKSIRAFTATLNEQKAKYCEVLAERDKYAEENEELRAIITNAGLEAPTRKDKSQHNGSSRKTSRSPAHNGKTSPSKSSRGHHSASPKVEEDDEVAYDQDTDVEDSSEEIRSPSPQPKKKPTTPAKTTRKRKSVDSEASPDVIPDSEELPKIGITPVKNNDDDETDYDSQDMFKESQDECLLLDIKKRKRTSPFKTQAKGGNKTS